VFVNKQGLDVHVLGSLRESMVSDEGQHSGVVLEDGCGRLERDVQGGQNAADPDDFLDGL
jgi:hypothetical protein